MKLFKKLKNKFKKSDSKSKFLKIMNDLEARHDWIEKKLDGKHTEEELEELHKEYDAIQRLISKCKKKLATYNAD